MRKLIAIFSCMLLTGALVGATPAAAVAATATMISIYLQPVPGVVGDQVRVLGVLERWSGSEWVGLAGRTVRLSLADANGRELLYLSTVTTNSEGLYTQTFRAPRSGAWRASFQPAFGDNHNPSARQTGWVNVVYRTRISGYSAGPRALPLGSKVTVKGRVHKLGVPNAFPLAGAKVQLFWSGDGQHWRWQADAYTNGAGDFGFSRAARADGYWTASLPAAGDYLFAGTGATWIDVKLRTRLTLNASPEPVRKGRVLTAKGTLKFVNAQGKLVPMGNRTIRIYFRTGGRGPGSLIGTARTSKAGAYIFKFRPTRAGGYRAGWDAVGTWLPATSGWDFVGVRR